MKNLMAPLNDGLPLGGAKPAFEYQPRGTGWFDRWRLTADESNDWMIDRQAQRDNRIFSGIDGIHLQDQAVTESMGPITDHSFEHLGPGDLMIARTRRRVLQAARQFHETGASPPGVDTPEIFLSSRSGFFINGSGGDWQQLYQQQVEQCIRPAAEAAAPSTPEAVPAK